MTPGIDESRTGLFKPNFRARFYNGFASKICNTVKQVLGRTSFDYMNEVDVNINVG